MAQSGQARKPMTSILFHEEFEAFSAWLTRNRPFALIFVTHDRVCLRKDPATLKFGPTGVEASPVRSKGQDYNRDGFSDLILTFILKETGIDCSIDSATLTGQTRTDPVTNITGTD